MFAVCAGNWPVHVSIISFAVVYELSVAVVVNSYELMEFCRYHCLFAAFRFHYYFRIIMITFVWPHNQIN